MAATASHAHRLPVHGRHRDRLTPGCLRRLAPRRLRGRLTWLPSPGTWTRDAAAASSRLADVDPRLHAVLPRAQCLPMDGHRRDRLAPGRLRHLAPRRLRGHLTWMPSPSTWTWDTAAAYSHLADDDPRLHAVLPCAQPI